MLHARLLPLALLLLLAASNTGCESKPKVARYDYQVSLTDTMRLDSGFVPSIEVDIVGVNDAEKADWDGLDVDAYFAPGNPRRRGMTGARMTFSNEAPGPQQLLDEDPVWTRWEELGVTHLYFLARMPRPEDAEATDPRKRVLVLTTDQWNPGQLIEVAVSPAGIQVLTSPKSVNR